MRVMPKAHPRRQTKPQWSIVAHQWIFRPVRPPFPPNKEISGGERGAYGTNCVTISMIRVGAVPRKLGCTAGPWTDQKGCYLSHTMAPRAVAESGQAGTVVLQRAMARQGKLAGSGSGVEGGVK